MVMNTLHVVLQQLCSIGHLVSSIAVPGDMITQVQLGKGYTLTTVWQWAGQSVSMEATMGLSTAQAAHRCCCSSKFAGRNLKANCGSWASLGWFHPLSLNLMLSR